MAAKQSVKDMAALILPDPAMPPEEDEEEWDDMHCADLSSFLFNSGKLPVSVVVPRCSTAEIGTLAQNGVFLAI